MKIFIKSNTEKQDSLAITEKVINILQKFGHDFFLDYQSEIPFISSEKYIATEEGVKNCDLIITIGGDGTLLSVGKLAAKFNKRILGINTGRLGFLTAIDSDKIEQLNQFFLDENFEIKKHYFLKVKINNHPWQYCLNDVVVTKHMVSNTVSISLYSNGDYLAELVCDGLIVSTSTGSTAYSLSVGGPIVDSDLKALIISPMAVHSLNSTPMVMAKDKNILIKFDKNRKQTAYVSYDGDNHTQITQNDNITVKLSERYAEIFALKGMGQFNKLDKKLKLR